MKNKLYKITSLIAGTIFLASGIALPAFAQTNVQIGVTASDSVATDGAGLQANGGALVNLRAAIITRAVDRADQEIARRVNALNSINTRINGMLRVSASDKSSISATIQSQISVLNTLQSQIATDASANSTSSLKTDIQSITKSYRIFLLVIPQGAIEAASDRILDIGASMMTLAGDLQTRITTAQSVGNNMDTSVTALADMNAKISDANTQANAAVSETASLQPDNGDQTIMQSNVAALKDAHTKIQAAQQDLITARKDAGTIVTALVSIKASAQATTTVN